MTPAKKLEKAIDVPLKDVEWRVDGKPFDGQGGGFVSRFVPYVSAATAAGLLDEWVGPGDWSDSYEMAEVAGKPALWCHLSVRVGDEWVTKRDVGVPSNFEAQKGIVSDAFKRAACLKWGIARNVYSLPTLWAPCNKNRKGDAVANDKTLPSIHKQLERLGFDAAGRIHEEADVEAGSQSEPPASNDAPASPASADVAPPAGSVDGGEANGKGNVTGTPDASTLPLDGEAEANEKDRLLDLVEQALDGGLIKLADVIRTASSVALQDGGTPPKNRGELKSQSLRVLATVVKHLKLEERVPA